MQGADKELTNTLDGGRSQRERGPKDGKASDISRPKGE